MVSESMEAMDPEDMEEEVKLPCFIVSAIMQAEAEVDHVLFEITKGTIQLLLVFYSDVLSA